MVVRRCTMNQIRRTFRSTNIVHDIFADFENCLSAAVNHIRSVNVIAIPTYTIYGLTVDAENMEAVRKLPYQGSRFFKIFSYLHVRYLIHKSMGSR
jgi:hypothetical protein